MAGNSLKNRASIRKKNKPSPFFTPEQKILNTSDDQHQFLQLSHSLQNALRNLVLTPQCQEILQELTLLRSLIERKISDAQMSSSSSSINLSLSSLGLCSNCPQDPDGPSFQAFLKEVSCPFCSEVQPDVAGFVRHLHQSCSPHLKKQFGKDENLDFCTFQILPNDTFKCNLCPNAVLRTPKMFFLHTQSTLHTNSFAKAFKGKPYKNFLFCVSCKTQVPSTYTQMSSHIGNEVHKIRRACKKTLEDFLHEGIHCVFSDGKKFKCLDCPVVACRALTDFLMHLKSPIHRQHRRNQGRYLPVIFCEVCLDNVPVEKAFDHFGSMKHREKEKKRKGVEVCFLCEFFCEGLTMLSAHMENCEEVKSIRKRLSLDEGGREAGKAEGSGVAVKDCKETPESLKSFDEFRKMLGTESSGDKITFEEADVDDTKPDLTADSSPESDSSPENADDDLMPQYDNLEELFRRVSDHAMKEQTSTSPEKEKISRDCILTLKPENSHFVGFSGCALSFPFETLSLFCHFDENLFADTLRPRGPLLSDSLPFARNLLKASYLRLNQSPLWKKVKVCTPPDPFAVIRCVHVETGKTCAFTFNKSALFLTVMLRDCMKECPLVRPFCMIVRFWLSVHELGIRKSEFALISLLVFFLLNINAVTLPMDEYEEEYRVQSLLNKGKLGVAEAVRGTARPFANVKELFEMFLEFVATFDFDKWVIFLPLSWPVAKSVMAQSGLEMMLAAGEDCSMCIFDPILCVNLCDSIEKADKKDFLKTVRETVKHVKITAD